MKPEPALRAASVAVCGATLAAGLWYLAAQARVPSWDDAWYLEVSFRLFHGPFLSEYVNAFRTKAPLLSVLPLPLYALFGPSEAVGPWVNLPMLALTLWGCKRVGSALFGEAAGWAAAAAAALLPLLYGLSRRFFVESLLTALVCLTVSVLARPIDRRRATKLGVLLGLGLLAKSLFPLYLLGPAWLKRRELRPWLGRILAVAVPLAGSWYFFNAPYVIGFGLSAGFGSIGRHYSTDFWSYAGSLGGDGVGWAWLLPAALLWLAAGAPRHRLLSAWLLPPAVVFALGVNRDIRYWAPVLPALAVLAGAAAAKRPRLAAAAVLPALALFCAQTFGVPEARALVYNGPPVRETGWDRAAVLDAAASAGARVVAVAYEHPRLNANNLSSLAAERGTGLRFVNLGHAQSSLEAALIRVKDKSADHLLVVEGEPPPDLPPFLNAVNEAVSARLVRGRRPLARVAVSPGLTAVLYAL